MFGNKRGNVVSNIILGGVIILALVTFGLYAQSALDGDGSRSAAERIVNQVVDFSVGISNATLGLLLGTKELAEDMVLLRMLAFILVAIVIVGALGSVEIFGTGSGAKWTNFFVGIIVAVIGVRFMPADLWGGLTAPSSALVAALFLGLPLAALIFIVLNVKVEIVRKVIVAAFIIFVGYLFFQLEEKSTKFVYLIVLAVSLALLFFDAAFRHYFYKEKQKLDIENTIGQIDAVERYNLRRKIENWQKIIADPTASAKERATAKGEITKLQKLYGDLSSV